MSNINEYLKEKKEAPKDENGNTLQTTASVSVLGDMSTDELVYLSEYLLGSKSRQ